MSSSDLEKLATERFDGIGLEQYGPYTRNKRTREWRVQATREEIADAFAYIVLMGRIDYPHREAERQRVVYHLEQVWAALDDAFSG